MTLFQPFGCPVRTFAGLNVCTTMHGDEFLPAAPTDLVSFRRPAPSSRAIRRHARRHGMPTLADQLAYWRAQRLGRQWARGGTAGWPAHVRVAVVLLLLLVALTIGVVFS
jgi:hypothetical protein